MTDAYVAVNRVEFSDGSIQAKELARGDRHECVTAAAYEAAFIATPPVIDGKEVTRSFARVMPAENWDSNPVRW